MNDINDVKAKIIDHLMSIDLSGLSMDDLTSYTKTAQLVVEMNKPDPSELIANYLTRDRSYNSGNASLSLGGFAGTEDK